MAGLGQGSAQLLAINWSYMNQAIRCPIVVLPELGATGTHVQSKNQATQLYRLSGKKISTPMTITPDTKTEVNHPLKFVLKNKRPVI